MITNPNSPTAITPSILATMDAGLANLRTGCAVLPTADAALLRRAAKMGLKSETFSREAIELAKQNAHLCPAGIDLEQAERTMAVRDALLSRYLQARQLAEALEVAMQVCGVDVFDTARTAYKSMKANCRDAALLELIDHLGRNFRSRRSEPQAAEPQPPAPAATRELAPSLDRAERTTIDATSAPRPLQSSPGDHLPRSFAPPMHAPDPHTASRRSPNAAPSRAIACFAVSDWWGCAPCETALAAPRPEFHAPLGGLVGNPTS